MQRMLCRARVGASPPPQSNQLQGVTLLVTHRRMHSAYHSTFVRALIHARRQANVYLHQLLQQYQCVCVCMQMYARTQVHECTLITTEHVCVCARAHTGRPGSAGSARHGTLPPVADYAYPAMGHAQILAQVCVLPHNGSGYESHPCMVKTCHMTCPARSSTGVFVNHVPRCVLSQVGTQGSGICAGMTCSACATTSWALFLGSSPEPMQL